MQPIRVIVCDDEPIAREGLVEMLREDPEILVIGEACAGRELLGLIERLNPDLIFLDVHLPELDGFDVLAALGERKRPGVVLVTAAADHAARAREAHAVDCLLKPFSNRRLAEALERAKAWLRRAPAPERQQRPEQTP